MNVKKAPANPDAKLTLPFVLPLITDLRCFLNLLCSMFLHTEILPKFHTISSLGGSLSLVSMCIAFLWKCLGKEKAFFFFIILVNALRAERAWLDETWESLLEFADSNVDLSSLECYFFLPLLSHPFSYITQTGYVWTLCFSRYK